ncbi:hypothetical protein [Nitrobacter sp.]|uniref:hypothetical protein n=1 Tax=Nitrobacter sp. TaxID=29420 RepID=UPI0029CAB818|nr:hypothetical protein [Nitrobacter sp.]
MNTVAIRTLSVNEAIADALRSLSAKFVARRIKTSTRTVEAWREGRTGPQAKHFVAMLHDDELCVLLLKGIGRDDLAHAAEVIAVKNRLKELGGE